MASVTVGLDYGTESARAVIVDCVSGKTLATAISAYSHGVIVESLPGAEPTVKLPDAYALQHPGDWLESAAEAVKRAMAGLPVDTKVIGLGVAFTSCTMLPAQSDGTPLGMTASWRNQPQAWPKLWKHHAANAQTEQINAAAAELKEPWHARYGYAVGLEWLFPKMLECKQVAPAVYDAADVWLEAGDWLVWQLTGASVWDASGPGCDRESLVKSLCQAGYKGCYGDDAFGSGYPSAAFLAAIGLPDVVGKLGARMQAPGTRAGGLSTAAAEALGLPAGTPVSTAIIDAHAGVIGAGVAEPGALVLVMGTSSCHMVMSHASTTVPGVAGVVMDGILPGWSAYETGQSAVGDAFAWASKTLKASHEELTAGAARLGPGSDGVLALDWLNGARTPLMDGRLSRALIGLTLSTTPAQVYRALLEGTAYGVRWIVDVLREGGVPVTRVVASGGLPRKSPLLVQIYADVLGCEIEVAAGDQPVALGAAVLGAMAAGLQEHGLPGLPALVARFAAGAAREGQESVVYRPQPAAVAQYAGLYKMYRALAADTTLLGAMRQLAAARH